MPAPHVARACIPKDAKSVAAGQAGERGRDSHGTRKIPSQLRRETTPDSKDNINNEASSPSESEKATLRSDNSTSKKKSRLQPLASFLAAHTKNQDDEEPSESSGAQRTESIDEFASPEHFRRVQDASGHWTLVYSPPARPPPRISPRGLHSFPMSPDVVHELQRAMPPRQQAPKPSQAAEGQRARGGMSHRGRTGKRLFRSDAADASQSSLGARSASEHSNPSSPALAVLSRGRILHETSPGEAGLSDLQNTASPSRSALTTSSPVNLSREERHSTRASPSSSNASHTQNLSHEDPHRNTSTSSHAPDENLMYVFNQHIGALDDGSLQTLLSEGLFHDDALSRQQHSLTRNDATSEGLLEVDSLSRRQHSLTRSNANTSREHAGRAHVQNVSARRSPNVVIAAAASRRPTSAQGNSHVHSYLPDSDSELDIHLSPRGHRYVSPRDHAYLSPREQAHLSPRTHTDLLLAYTLAAEASLDEFHTHMHTFQAHSTHNYGSAAASSHIVDLRAPAVLPTSHVTTSETDTNTPDRTSNAQETTQESTHNVDNIDSDGTNVTPERGHASALATLLAASRRDSIQTLPARISTGANSGNRRDSMHILLSDNSFSVDSHSGTPRREPVHTQRRMVHGSNTNINMSSLNLSHESDGGSNLRGPVHTHRRMVRNLGIGGGGGAWEMDGASYERLLALDEGVAAIGKVCFRVYLCVCLFVCVRLKLDSVS
jgi:hypothetical protein